MVATSSKKVSTTIQLPKDLYDRLEWVKESYGSSHNFVIEKALRLFFAEDLDIVKKSVKHGRKSHTSET